jgi:Tfp pilus assembly protein PilN
MRKVQRYAVAGAVAVGVLLVAFGALNFLRVHSAESGVNALTASVASLNAQIPTYDKVVAADNELKTSEGQVSTVTTSAVDWAAVVAELSKTTPTGLSLTSFTGTAQTPGGAAAAPTGATSPSTAIGTAPSGAVGTVTLNVGGTFPSAAHFSPVAEWIDDISGSTMFEAPGVSGVTNTASGANTSLTFQSTLSLTSGATLAKNGKS